MSPKILMEDKMNPISNLIKHLKKHGYKKTMKDWKRNFLIIQTPEIITNQKIFGTWGSMLGLIVIFIAFIYKDVLYATIAIGFGIYLQYVSLKQLYLQKQTLQDITEQYEEVKE